MVALALLLVRNAPVFAGDVVGKVTVGYQGWFAAPNDGGPEEAELSNGFDSQHLTYIDTYPDLREFPGSEKFPSQFSPLPNGNAASMFSSDRAATVNLHAAWMRQYGIDCVAMQRFWQAVDGDPGFTKNDTQVENLMNKACAANNLKFYIEYDLSGTGAAATSTKPAPSSIDPNGNAHWVNEIETDWQNLTDPSTNTALYQSTAYAHEGGKPVVELFGIGNGQEGVDSSVSNATAIINYFKGKGCYVIAGTNIGWLEFNSNASLSGSPLQGYTAVYQLCNAISPWSTNGWTYGSTGNEATDATSGADAYSTNNLVKELAWCRSQNPPIDYIPDIWPGFSSHNVTLADNGANNAQKINGFPRSHGDLMWEEFYNVAHDGITSCFIGMFDEVNEGTNIMKAAEDASMLPTGSQPFVAMNADGTACSADFYLRLTSDGGAMIKGQLPLQKPHPTTFTNDLFKTGFESGQPQPTWTSSVISSQNVTGPTCAPISGASTADDSSVSLAVKGTANGGSTTYCYYKVFDESSTPLSIQNKSLLYYWIYPVQSGSTSTAGEYVGVDFTCTDGTTLRGSGAVDQNGNSMNPAAGHGQKLTFNAWNIVTCDLSLLAGKQISQISVGFEDDGATGPYTAYIDNIQITAGSRLTSLWSNQVLNSNESMFSADGRAELTMQKDNNLVLYDLANGGHVAKWQSNTSQSNPALFAYAVMQVDGNFVVKTSSSVLWASGSNGNTDATLTLLSSGDLVIYNLQGGLVWSTGTSF